MRRAALNAAIEEDPGTEFLYNNYNPQILGLVLERVAGMTVTEYLETRLWQPMGAEFGGSWSIDSTDSGFELMIAGINARAIDFAKLGWLFLNQGRIGEHQVVPSEWVEEATRLDTKTDPAAEYQYFWWIDEARDAYTRRPVLPAHLCLSAGRSRPSAHWPETAEAFTGLDSSVKSLSGWNRW